ncbi:hypothetical protein CN448_31320 [Bacillus cereus]|uniref:Uncharacterized protein n=1 Tax=Bacillus cereus HuB4-4 TaxID=1053211 RepID=A0A9W5QPE7_BACCE|nr:hypothetical protein [Bacillus cereus]EOP80887.1 hypothetical protein IGM_05613 [Bacillus cereus HuB4-4]PEW59166.1 hypothetical protein CN448_31320 [Bacillus cereus]
MNTAKFKFNRNPVHIGYDKAIEQPSIEILKNTPALWNASLDDALKYGGELTKAAISAMNLRHDRKYIVVDTKVHMLMPGMCPAIPNWHSDGVPRGLELRPEAKAEPNIFAQEKMSNSRFHLLVTGEGCLTEFIGQPVELDVPEEPNTKLYSMVNQQVREKVGAGELEVFTAPTCTPIEFDWFDIHRGIEATKHEWRYLIRVTETDHMPPQTDLRQIIRTQQQVYVPTNFGW